jgi:hypothetical protein
MRLHENAQPPEGEGLLRRWAIYVDGHALQEDVLIV